MQAPLILLVAIHPVLGAGNSTCSGRSCGTAGLGLLQTETHVEEGAHTCAQLAGLDDYDVSSCDALLPGEACVVMCKDGFVGDPVTFMCLSQLAEAGQPPVGLRTPFCIPAGQSAFVEGEQTTLWERDGSSCLRCDSAWSTCSRSEDSALCTNFEMDLSVPRVVKVGTNQCLDMFGGPQPGIWGCNGGANQKFKVVDTALQVSASRGTLSYVKEGTPSPVGFVPSNATLAPAVEALRRDDKSSFLRTMLPLQMCKARFESGTADEFWDWLLQQEPGMLKALFSSFPVVPGQVHMLQDIRRVVTPEVFESLRMHSFAVALSFLNRWNSIDKAVTHQKRAYEINDGNYLAEDIERIRQETIEGQHSGIQSNECRNLHTCCGHYSNWTFKWPRDPNPSVGEFAQWWVQKVEEHGSHLWLNPFRDTPWIFNVYLWPTPLSECEWVHAQLIDSPPISEGSWYYYNSSFHLNICLKGDPKHHPDSLGGIAIYGGVCGRMAQLEWRKQSCMGVPAQQKGEPGHSAGMKLVPTTGRYTTLSWSNTSVCLHCPAAWKACIEVDPASGMCDEFIIDEKVRNAVHVRTGGQCLNAHSGPSPGLWSCGSGANNIVEVIQPHMGCNESEWPDKRYDLVCGACKVLVARFSGFYKTCDGYCQRIGRTCVGAWEESGDTCEVRYGMTCNQTLSSNDAICECSPEVERGFLVYPETGRGVFTFNVPGGGPLPESETRWAVNGFHEISCPQSNCHFESPMPLRSAPGSTTVDRHKEAMLSHVNAFQNYERDGLWPIAHDEARLAATLAASLRDMGQDDLDVEDALAWALTRNPALYEAWEEAADLAGLQGLAASLREGLPSREWFRTLPALLQRRRGASSRNGSIADGFAKRFTKSAKTNRMPALEGHLVASWCNELSDEELSELQDAKAGRDCKRAREGWRHLDAVGKKVEKAADAGEGNAPTERFDEEFAGLVQIVIGAERAQKMNKAEELIRQLLGQLSVGYINKRTAAFFAQHGRVVLRGPYSMMLHLASRVLPESELTSVIASTINVLEKPHENADKLWSADKQALKDFLGMADALEKTTTSDSSVASRELGQGEVDQAPDEFLEKFRLDQDLRVELGSRSLEAAVDDGGLEVQWPGSAESLLQLIFGGHMNENYASSPSLAQLGGVHGQDIAKASSVVQRSRHRARYAVPHQKMSAEEALQACATEMSAALPAELFA